MSDLKSEIERCLSGLIDPHLDRDLMSSKAVKDITVEGDQAKIEIVLGYPAKGYFDELAGQVKAAVEAIDGIAGCEVAVSFKIVEHKVQKNLDLVPGVKNIIAVASGKGGVGKSTTAVNLALALSVEGAKVGILDADIYGPSQPRMLGIKGRPDSPDGKTLDPMMSYHLQAMSIGFLVEVGTPVIWRGPMGTRALGQLLTDTNWRDRDFLLIALPPGTGDMQLTLAQ